MMSAGSVYIRRDWFDKKGCSGCEEDVSFSGKLAEVWKLLHIIFDSFWLGT